MPARSSPSLLPLGLTLGEAMSRNSSKETEAAVSLSMFCSSARSSVFFTCEGVRPGVGGGEEEGIGGEQACLPARLICEHAAPRQAMLNRSNAVDGRGHGGRGGP